MSLFYRHWMLMLSNWPRTLLVAGIFPFIDNGIHVYHTIASLCTVPAALVPVENCEPGRTWHT
jgi:hypothetical protein